MTGRRLSRYGLALQVPAGWDARVLLREPAGQETTHPVLHAGNFRLPATARADYGSDLVARMREHHVLVVVKEFAPHLSTTALYRHPVPWPLAPEAANPAGLQRTITGQSGCQLFFSHHGRAFCLYVVLGSHARRETSMPVVNELLARLDIEHLAARRVR